MYKDFRVRFNAKQSLTSKFSLFRNIYAIPSNFAILSVGFLLIDYYGGFVAFR